MWVLRAATGAHARAMKSTELRAFHERVDNAVDLDARPRWRGGDLARDEIDTLAAFSNAWNTLVEKTACYDLRIRSLR